jgi:hypothetical protein
MSTPLFGAATPPGICAATPHLSFSSLFFFSSLSSLSSLCLLCLLCLLRPLSPLCSPCLLSPLCSPCPLSLPTLPALLAWPALPALLALPTLLAPLAFLTLLPLLLLLLLPRVISSCHYTSISDNIINYLDNLPLLLTRRCYPRCFSHCSGCSSHSSKLWNLCPHWIKVATRCPKSLQLLLHQLIFF